MRAFYDVGDLSSYDTFVARVKLALGSQRDFGELLIQRRGLGFCADDTEHAPVSFDSNYSFCFHAVKGVEKALESLTGCLDLVLECSEPQTSCKGNMDSIRGTMLRQFQPTRPGLGQVNDIEDCWPHCSQEIPSSVWKKIAKGLASYSGCWHCYYSDPVLLAFDMFSIGSRSVVARLEKFKSLIAFGLSIRLYFHFKSQPKTPARWARHQFQSAGYTMTITPSITRGKPIYKAMLWFPGRNFRTSNPARPRNFYRLERTRPGHWGMLHGSVRDSIAPKKILVLQLLGECCFNFWCPNCEGFYLQHGPRTQENKCSH